MIEKWNCGGSALEVMENTLRVNARTENQRITKKEGLQAFLMKAVAEGYPQSKVG